MFSIERIAPELVEKKGGLYFSTHDQSDISFPEEIHADLFNYEEDSFWYQHRNSCIIKIMSLFPPQEPLFDIGGGNGIVSLALKKYLGIEVCLVEPTLVGATNALKRGLHPVICSSLENANFRSSTMSSIGLFDVLEHIKDDDSFLALNYQYLMPGGRLYITVPTYNFLWSVEDENSGHYRRYRPALLVKKLKSSGFEIEYTTCFFRFLPFFIFILRTIPSRLGLRKSSPELTHIDFKHGKLVRRLLKVFLDYELKILKNKKRMIFGSSFIIVARKKTSL